LLRAIQTAAQGKPTLHPEAQSYLIRRVSAPASTPQSNLTERELDVLRLIALGQSNKEIAATLHLTEGTIKGYVSAILAKLGVADRTQAALYAVKHGLADNNR
jgi:DNA-binding NarL/FixJ family response regulator